jgi:NADH-quinone oxidoreductase subunit N
MLALAGFPATAGFFGKIFLIDAAVNNGYGWLGIVIVIGSAVSLAYYLRVIAAVWMRAPSEASTSVMVARPAIAGGSPEADVAAYEAGHEPGAATTARLLQPEVVFVAVVCAIVTIAFGIYPQPLLDVAQDAGAAIKSLL